MACKVIEKWEVEKKELEKAIQTKDKEYSRAIEETDKNMRNIASLKKELKSFKVAANQSARLTEERIAEYEERVAELKRKIDEKDARLGKLEIHNKRMEEINCDLEKRVKVMTVAERKLQQE